MKRNNGGYTLAEVMITLGVLAILGMIVFQIYRGVLTDSRNRQLSSTRDQVVIQIRQSASNARGLVNSLNQPGNEQFFNCVCGQGTGCDSGKVYTPFTLYDLQTSPVVPVTAYYDASGIPCNRNVPNCLIEVTFSFIAQCLPDLPDEDPSPPPHCSTPVELFGILFKVQQNPLTIPTQGALLKAVSGTAYTQVSALNTAGVCP